MKNFLLSRRAILITSLLSLFTFWLKSEKLRSNIVMAFGSCSNQTRKMKHWKAILSKNPDYLILLGDNVYGYFNDAKASQFVNAYNMLKKDAYFNLLKMRTQIISIWDDHDYGKNDEGHSWKFKEKSKALFLDFFFSKK